MHSKLTGVATRNASATNTSTSRTPKWGAKRPRSIRCPAKKDLHPEFHNDSKVICNGEEVFSVSGTKKEYVVDVWSGNHPFYLNGQGGAMILDDERISKFNKKYAGLDLFGDGAGDKK
ncbi:ribosomal protein L31 [Chloropicon primus]|uniref:50S ribosomal protein L31 n=1 Tax=Chloropicon primus TaxID=1764295 RepID=A0A5B8ML13_9CHLO|nr:ribosomal protein L31 [Chloropicon primus]UPR00524.1 ribosomal protein L31 [Chloropicon primus]|eukprot:QDZ21308.1 ribosomal protein L31 [Chloropicon primus]